MNGAEDIRPDLIGSGIPTAGVAFVALVLVAAWIGVHRWRPFVEGGAPAGAVWFLVRVAVASAAIWMVLQWTGRVLVLGSAWPLWAAAVVGGASIETVFALYRWEMGTVSKRRGRILLALRLGAVALVLFILVEPIFARLVERRIEREVVVLVDDSESMRLVDSELDAGERLRLGRLAGIAGADEQPRLDSDARRLGEMAREFLSLAELLDARAPDEPPGDDAAARIRDALTSAVGELESLCGRIDMARDRLPQDLARVAENGTRMIRERVTPGLGRFAGGDLPGSKSGDVRDSLRAVARDLENFGSEFATLADAFDAAWLDAMTAGEQESIDRLASQTRGQIAERILFGGETAAPGTDDPGLVAKLGERYGVRVVRFARDVTEISGRLGAAAAAADGSPIVPAEAESGPGALVGPRSVYRYFVPQDDGLDRSWMMPAFDDGRWRRGSGVIGFAPGGEARERIETRVDARMRREGSGIYLRIPFEVADPTKVAGLEFDVRCDGGFVAYLNGAEVARDNAPEGSPQWNSRAVSVGNSGVSAPPGRTLRLDSVVAGAGALSPGPNVLAIHVLNNGPDANHLHFASVLRAIAPDDEGAVGGGGSSDEDESLRTTDIARALEAASEEIAPETLAGVVLLSDGRHNAESPLEDVSRRLGVLGAPVGAVVVGAERGAPDASVLELSAPESIYLEDRIPVRAEVKFEGLKGRSARVVLVRDGEAIDEQVVDVPDDQFRTQIRFRHVPENKGVFSYSVRIDPVEGERFAQNNEWRFSVAVTDDRRNVLLVDSYPRWEFRYLRNLFYARDKSVHLQYVLLNPEPIAGAAPLASVAASASRPFGEAEATELPRTAEEWLKFDAIILGDVPPAAFTSETWRTIDRCVRERGAMLVLIAGQRYLPHAFDDALFRELVPVEYAFDPAPRFDSPEPEYRIALTAEGRASDIMRQAPSGLVNASIWAGMPTLYWRHPVLGTKEGADVLAYASVEGAADRTGVGATSLLEQRRSERAAPLMVTRRFALGSVAMLLFDRTWRFRFGVGDTYHHRLWGQLLRWGTGENLRAGTEFVRLGTDQLDYRPGQTVSVVSRITGRDYRPVIDDEVNAVIYRDGERVLRVPLRYREASNGIHEGSIDGFAEPGRYRVVLESDRADGILAEDGGGPLEVEFEVSPERNPVELTELSVDAESLRTVCSLSGGSVVAPDETDRLLELFGEPAKTIEESVETTLWDKWPVLLLFLGLVSAEWIVRRQGGLV